MFERLRNPGWAGVAVLVGAAALAPTVWPAVGRTVRPAAKSALKAGMIGVEQARERMAELSEVADDLWAEVRFELDEERRARAENEEEPPADPGNDQPDGRPATDAA